MTTKHFSEAELLETYYMQPGESMPVMMHLAACSECAERYKRLERKLREAAACPTKPVTFWAFQRGSIMRRVEAKRRETAQSPRTWRVAAAAMLAFFLGGAIVYETVRPGVRPATAVVETAALTAPTATAAPELVADPWQSEELQDFHAVVQWESWVNEKDSKRESSL
jgi:anti-sigma factor RsiW